MITFLVTALKIIFVLGFLILIHEAGHFFVARLCKVTVNEFSIGFGPVIWKKQGKKTKYTLRLIPLGGFVNLEGEEERSEQEGSFSKASIPRRMAIILAGGLVNIIFAIIVYYCLMACVGNNTSLVVESTIENYAAEIAGVQAGDKIVKIDGKKIYTKNDIDKIMKESKEERIITIEREGVLQEISLIPTKQEYRNTGIYLKALSSGDSTKIITIEAESSAEKQGLKANDEIIEINGKKMKNQTEIIEMINNQEENNSLIFTVKRGDETLTITIQPEIMYQYYLGIYFAKAENSLSNNLYYAVFETKDFVFSIFDNLKMLFTGEVRVDQFMGPVGISEVVSKTNGIKDFVYILALISLSLGVTNLLPIPALDGGKFLLLVIEAIRRKKLSEKIEININLIGFTFLIALSFYITYHDILRIL